MVGEKEENKVYGLCLCKWLTASRNSTWSAVRLCYSPPSFRLGSAKTKLAGSIPALPTSRKAILVMCHGGNQTNLLYMEVWLSGLRHLSRKQWALKGARGFKSYYFRQFYRRCICQVYF